MSRVTRRDAVFALLPQLALPSSVVAEIHSAFRNEAEPGGGKTIYRLLLKHGICPQHRTGCTGLIVPGMSGCRSCLDSAAEIMRNGKKRKPRRRRKSIPTFDEYASRIRSDLRDPGPRPHKRKSAVIRGRHRAEIKAITLTTPFEFKPSGTHPSELAAAIMDQLILKYTGRAPWPIVTPDPDPGIVEFAASLGVEIRGTS